MQPSLLRAYQLFLAIAVAAFCKINIAFYFRADSEPAGGRTRKEDNYNFMQIYKTHIHIAGYSRKLT